VSSSGTGTDAKPKGLLKTIAFEAEKYHYIIRRLPGYMPKAVGACKRILVPLLLTTQHRAKSGIGGLPLIWR
jgi:hypothetical protein